MNYNEAKKRVWEKRRESYLHLSKIILCSNITDTPMGFSPSREIRYGWMACLIGTAAMDAVVILENSITGQPLDTSFVLFGSCAQNTLCKSKL